MAYVPLKIDQILLDEENPRITSIENQRDALVKIIRDQGAKLVVLGADMLKHGTSPIELILVTKSKSRSGKYVVLEGNRRIAILKILSNPQVLKSLNIDAALAKRLMKLSESFDRKAFEPVYCFEVDTRIEGQHWIELKHNGEDGGRGTVRWSPLVAARFRGENPAVQALEFLKEKADLGEDDMEKVESPRFPLTTLERVLGAVSVREKIGVDIKDGSLITTLEDTEIVKPLKRVVLDLAHKRVNVSDLKSVSQMEKYVDSFAAKERPNLSKTKPPTKAKVAPKKRAKPKPKRPTIRPTVIPSDTDYQIDDPRTDKIYEELKGLDVNVYQNACSVLMRLFLEFSLLDYMRKNKIRLTYDKGKNSGNPKSLNDMLSDVIDDVISKDLSLAADFKFLKHSINQKKSPLFVGLLHQFVHNRAFAPTSEELRITWDNSRPLFDAIWKP